MGSFWTWNGWPALVSIGTLFLAGGTFVLAYLTRRSVDEAKGARKDLRDSADAARTAAQATSRQALATEDLVHVATEEMRRAARPILVDAGEAPRVVAVGETHTSCTITLRNVGAFAVVDEGNRLGIGAAMRASPTLAWEGSSLRERMIPAGGEVRIEGSTTTRPQGVPPSRPAIYVRILYMDVHGEQATTTYLCLWQANTDDFASWEVVGTALDLGVGTPLRTGHGWSGFVTRVGVDPWPD